MSCLPIPAGGRHVKLGRADTIRTCERFPTGFGDQPDWPLRHRPVKDLRSDPSGPRPRIARHCWGLLRRGSPAAASVINPSRSGRSPSDRKSWWSGAGSNRRHAELQSAALPLGYLTKLQNDGCRFERPSGLTPLATTTLGPSFQNWSRRRASNPRRELSPAQGGRPYLPAATWWTRR